MDHGELIDLLAETVAALDAAYTELVQLDEGDLPVPDKVDRLLREHAAMKATLARLPASLRDRAVGVYREEMEHARPEMVELSVPVLDEVKRRLGEMFETLRRSRLVDGELYRALDL